MLSTHSWCRRGHHLLETISFDPWTYSSCPMEWKELHLCLLPFPAQQGGSACCLPGCDKLLGNSQDPGVILSLCQLYIFFCPCLMITALKLISAIYIRQSFFILLFRWRKCWELGLLFKCPGILGYRFTMICARSASSLANNLEIILIPSQIEVECK